MFVQIPRKLLCRISEKKFYEILKNEVVYKIRKCPFYILMEMLVIFWRVFVKVSVKKLMKLWKGFQKEILNVFSWVLLKISMKIPLKLSAWFLRKFEWVKGCAAKCVLVTAMLIKTKLLSTYICAFWFSLSLSTKVANTRTDWIPHTYSAILVLGSLIWIWLFWLTVGNRDIPSGTLHTY